MAFSPINKSTDYFNTKLYTGNNGSQSITGVGFQPDMTWIKKRNGAADSSLMDSVRGVRKSLTTNNTEVEYTESAGLASWDSDGFTFDGAGYDHVNTSNTFASWNWKAGGAGGSANTDGDIDSTVSVNTTAGFSIVKYTGTGSAQTVGHGLGVAPNFIILKESTATSEWQVSSDALGWTKRLNLNDNSAIDTTSTIWNNTAPTSTVFSIGTSGAVTESGQTYIAYCFAEKSGYSKQGSYTGNGNANGTFVYTGFRTNFFFIKRYDNTESWIMVDSKRGFPQSWNYLLGDSSAVEGGALAYDMVTNGIKFRGTSQNESGATYIYLAIGQPIISNSGVVATAR